MRVLLDMNLPRSWLAYLAEHGIDTVHWAAVGHPRAPDAAIMRWARDQRCVVFTNDLDSGTALALTRAVGPSVLQVRTLQPLPATIGALVLSALRDHRADLELGALVVIDGPRLRARLLPLGVPPSESEGG